MDFLVLVNLALGISLLLPWNAYVKAIDYFRWKLVQTRWEANFPSFISSGYTMAITGGILLFGLVGPENKLMGNRERILTALFLNTALLATMAIFPLLEIVLKQQGISGNNFFGLLMSLVGVTGIVTALLQKGTYATLAVMPSKYTPWLMAGQSVSGIFISILNLLLSMLRQSISRNAVVFFGLSSLVVGGTGLAILLTSQMNLEYRAWIDSGRNAQKASGQKMDAMKKIWAMALGVMGTLMGTLAIFASFITGYPGKGLAWVLVIYDLGDLLGRGSLSIDFIFQMSQKLGFVNLVLPWLRILVFLPLFRMTFKLQNDVIFILVSFLFGVSNGYCCTQLLMEAPQKAIHGIISKINGDEPDSNERDRREAAGVVMGLFINVGLASGSLLSFIVRKLFI